MREPDLENTATKKRKNTEEVRETRMTQHTLNTILRGFSGGGETSSDKKRYARTVTHVSQNPLSEREGKPTIIGFSRQDSEGVLAHENDLMVMKVQIHDWSIKRALIDRSSSTDILY